MSRNAEIAALLEEYAALLEARDIEYKPNTYRRAAESIREHPTAIEDLVSEGRDAVEGIDGVGEAISAKVIEYVETGAIEELEEERANLPVAMDELTSVEGVGPKTVGTLYEELGVTNLAELEEAASAGEIQELKGFGPKTEENILDGLEFARQARERELLGDTRPLADDLLEYLRSREGVERAEVAGSIRRWRETSGDVDVLASSDDLEGVVGAFTDWERAERVIESGENKASVVANGIRVDLRAVVPEEFGSALQYFTGSKAHNIRFRNRALDRDLKVNEYGVFDISDVEDTSDQRAGERVAGETEESMYAALDLEWIPPELREDTGEIDAAAAGDLPELIEEGDLRGDLHTHTDWSDGTESIGEWIASATEFGHEYICISDHATGPGMVGGVGVPDEELLEQADEIREAAEDAEIEVFSGVEANVDETGGLSVAEDVLGKLDIVIASPHSALDMDPEAATDRLVAAISHPETDVLGHPTGRLLTRRPGLDPDLQRVAEAAADHGVALEVNANPARLDLWGRAVKVAIEAGAKIVVNTDAHSASEFENSRYGVHTARRGWAEPKDVLNAWDATEVREFVGR
ncbi:DNA polymerase/3'-5' exonuclease PolX [Halalkalicoccus sp. NIPERK01]|uniref:DNA polymerase/3'-5' exonuclease PolX n=1 Tax=Halalkalicoccus sp. NIPERK01 TaxID=3053469 RepID=UPI00256F2C13|nr:DNA polymerase/3'-5' exonuclease PolX [Halalkalicoccus sp. NIPERK01]MDL5361616.1 DNA polymerase/3'-5' exonuclease PolX [Halalkalicoccus sp. NIPERK01]